MRKRVAVYSVLFACIGAVVALSAQGLLHARSRPRRSAPLRNADLRGAPSRGPKDAKVTVVLWGDLDCQHTAAVYPMLRKLADRPDGDVRLVWKDNPVAVHPAAMRAARIGLAADEQGRFWDFADRMLADPQRVGEEDLDLTVNTLNIDLPKYRAALASGRLDLRLQNETVEAGRLAVLGTPTMFFNGRAVEGAPPESDLLKMIDEARIRADLMLATGVPREQLYAKLLASAPNQIPRALGTIPISDERQAIDTRNAPARGPARAPVEIVMFGDYECPFCKEASQVLNTLVERYPSQLRFVWKHHPLTIHQNARIAAKAAMAAAAQDRFWPMHELLMANQDHLDRAALDSYARRIGLNLDSFRSDFDRVEQEVNQQTAEGDRLAHGQMSTPTFYINGRQLIGMQPIEVFNALVQQELSPAGAHGALAAN